MAEDADIDRQVAARLRQIRLDRGLTLARLAEVTGLSAAHLSRIETGERQPSVGSLL
jgi:transcriptional regulator with XRE-family HTH domain